MTTRRLTYAAAALALVAGPAFAQTAAAPARPTTAAPTAGAPATANPARPATATPGAAAPAGAAAQAGASATAMPATPGAAGYRPLAASGDVVATLQASGEFTQLLKAVDLANLTSVLKGPNITIFAPTDAAFAAATPSQKAALAATDHGQKLLAYHVVNTRVEAAQLNGAFGPVPSVIGPNLYLDGTKQPARVNDANVLQASVTASNGVIWVVDKVLDASFTPPPAPAPTAAPATPGQ